jgi:hypothetical protein
MAQRVIANAGTGAVNDGSQVAFSLQAKHFRHGMKPIISIEGIAGAETVPFWFWTNGDWEELDDGTGSQTTYTATYAADVFNGPGTFGFTKSATVGAIVVSLDDGL